MNAGRILERIQQEWSRARRRGPKTAAEVALVVLFLLLFYGLLKIVFPEGAGLQGLIREGDESVSGGQGRYLVRDGGKVLPGSIPIAGYVEAMRNDVRSRRADSIAWGKAAPGLRLFSRDAVQTARDSSASIWVGGRGTIDLGEKSLLIVQRLEQERSTKTKRSILLMVDGEIRGKIEGSRKEPVSVELASVGGVGRIVSKGGKDGPTDFRVTVNPDKTTTYSVFSGSALVEGLGKSVNVGANQFTVVSPWAPPTTPAMLPAAPEILGPSDGAEYVFRSLPPRVKFHWKPMEEAESFRVVLARDREFKSVVVDEWTAGSSAPESPDGSVSFVHGSLPEGRYFWRVTAKRGGIESGYPKSRAIRVVRKANPPALKAEATVDVSRGDFCVVRGATEPGASLLVAGKPVPMDGEGRFESIVPLERGVNMVVVEASDAAGNTAYRSLRVNGK